MKLRTGLLLIGGGSIALGLFKYFQQQRRLLEAIGYKVVGIDIVESSFQNVKLLITLKLTNNSEIDFTIGGYTLNVFVNGVAVSKVVNATIDEKVKGKGQSKGIKFYADFSPQQLLQGDLITDILTSGNIGNTDIAVKGIFTIKKYGFKLTDYPVDISLKLEDFV
jgi:LEA14-like dessication related protein